LTYQFPAFATETRNTKHILENKPISFKKSVFCWNETKIKVWKNQTTLEAANHGRKSIRKHGKYPVNVMKSLGRFCIVILSIKECITLLLSKFLMGLSINQTKYCKTTFRALPHVAYLLFNRPVVAKTTLLRQKSQKSIVAELQLNLQKQINVCRCSFKKYRQREKPCCKKIWT